VTLRPAMNPNRSSCMNLAPQLPGMGWPPPRASGGGGGRGGGRGPPPPPPRGGRLRVVLWRADAVAGVVEVSGGPAGLAVTRADDAAGLIFGACPKALLKRSAAR
jgi:hypothetical protein